MKTEEQRHTYWHLNATCHSPFFLPCVFRVLFSTHLSFQRLINRIQQVTKRQKKVCGGGCPPRQTIRTPKNKTDTHTVTQRHNLFYISEQSADVSLLFRTQPT